MQQTKQGLFEVVLSYFYKNSTLEFVFSKICMTEFTKSSTMITSYVIDAASLTVLSAPSTSKHVACIIKNQVVSLIPLEIIINKKNF